ncbi:MAG: hypothetical protein WAR79_05060 [Melioribacteraceae bacterium]
MKTLKLFFASIIFNISNYILPQTENQLPRNNYYFEILGNAGFWSFNYERIIKNSSIIKLGLDYVPRMENSFISSPSFLSIPIDYCYLFSLNGNVKIELGTGLTFYFGENNFGDKDRILVNGILGYRYQPIESGTIFRITFTPVIESGEFRPWFGISFGHNF